MVLQIIAHFEGVIVSLGACFLHCLQYSENISSPSSHRSTYRKRQDWGANIRKLIPPPSSPKSLLLFHSQMHPLLHDLSV